MLGFEDMPVEVRVLDFIPAKIEELCGCGRKEKNEQDEIWGGSFGHESQTKNIGIRTRVSSAAEYRIQEHIGK
jgi:hypothetical protein